MKRAWSFATVLALMAVSAAMCAAAVTPDDCQKLEHHGQQGQANACYETLTSSADPYLRAEGFWGLQEYDDANKAFRDALAANDASAQIRVRWGMLFHERFNDKDAADLFHEALQRDP